MARTGRPVINRTSKSLTRDIATLKRLRNSVKSDERIDATSSSSLVLLIDRVINALERINL